MVYDYLSLRNVRLTALLKTATGVLGRRCGFLKNTQRLEHPGRLNE
jgi:hypothetical protein